MKSVEKNSSSKLDFYAYLKVCFGLLTYLSLSVQTKLRRTKNEILESHISPFLSIFSQNTQTLTSTTPIRNLGYYII